MAAVRERPVSPHLTIWRWGPHMLVSILHRITGAGLTLIGLTWAFFQKTFAGIRHLVMDTGMGFELRRNKLGAVLTIVGSLIATALLWAYWLGVLK